VRAFKEQGVTVVRSCPAYASGIGAGNDPVGSCFKDAAGSQGRAGMTVTTHD
jgi:hypothetical protein